MTDANETFVFGTAYEITTLPDDLYDDKPNDQIWAIRDVLLWNNCQGWWIESVSDYLRDIDRLGHSACRWMPLPPHPMSWEEANQYLEKLRNEE